MPKLYSFDVDHTLALRGHHAPGPVELKSLMELRDLGHIVGLCGNWAAFVNLVPQWQTYISFLGTFSGYKPTMLRQLKLYIHAQEFILVGNDPLQFRIAVSNDKDAARQAGYRFISETDFARGIR